MQTVIDLNGDFVQRFCVFELRVGDIDHGYSRCPQNVAAKRVIADFHGAGVERVAVIFDC